MHVSDFVITIRQPDYKSANAISIMMLTLAISVFGYTAWRQWPSRIYHNVAILYFLFCIVIFLWCVYSIFFAKKINRIPYYRFALAVAAIGWFIGPLSNYWMGGLFLLAAIAERQVKFPLEIGADAQGITFNSLPAKFYAWHQINNMLLKDGILTIDYKNNTIFQKEIESDVSPALENELNEYCRQKLSGVALSGT